MSKYAFGSVLLAALIFASAGGARNAAVPTLFLSPTGLDANNSCAVTAPCLTFDRAYHVAQAGSVVEVAAGAYATQTIKVDLTKAAGPDVIFQPAPDAQVTVGRVNVSGTHIEFRDMAFPWSLKVGASNITLRNIKSDGAVNVTGASNVLVQGGEIFSSVPVSTDSSVASIGGLVPTNVVFDGVYFHDFQDSLAGGINHHIECLQVGAADGLTIENSRFQRCYTHDIFIRSWGFVNNSPAPIKNVLIQNNYLALTTNGFYAIQVLDDLAAAYAPSSAVVRNNTALQGFNVKLQYGTQQVVGNIIPSMSLNTCNVSGKGYDYNVYGSGVRCGIHDRVGAAQLADVSGFDYRLLPGSLAIGAGDPLNSTATDIFGRPRGTSPDAGASQFDGQPPTAPGAISVTGSTETTATVAWGASADDTGVAGYSVYLDGAKVAQVTDSSASVPGLLWGSHDIQVEAFDAAGNVSPRSQYTLSSSWH